MFVFRPKPAKYKAVTAASAGFGNAQRANASLAVPAEEKLCTRSVA